MKGYIRNIPVNERFGFIRGKAGLDNIFFHAKDYDGNWKQLSNHTVLTQDKIYVEFELSEGSKGLCASKCKRITVDEYNSED